MRGRTRPARSGIWRSRSCGCRRRWVTRSSGSRSRTLLTRADIGAKAHAVERLDSLVRQVPLRRL
eukprot:6088302-Pyramimonas_sp.AAC.1